MGIGTSQGAYYDSEFHMQASKWQDGWDNNELDPEVNDTHTEDKNAIPAPVDSSQPQEVGWRDTLAKLQDKGLLSGPRPLQMDVLTQQQQAAGMPGVGPGPFEQFMATRGRNQPSNIVERPVEETTPAPLAGRPVDHPDFTALVNEHYNQLREFSDSHANEAWQPRGIQPGETLRQFAEREVNRADPDLRYQGHRQEPNPEFEQVPLQEEHTSSWNAIPEYIQRRSDEINKQFETQKVDKKGQISVVSDTVRNPQPNSHSFVFKNDEGVTGDLRLTERMNGKELYVNWIGAHGRDGPHDLGTSEIRNLLGILKDKFPQAEFMSGFRVSGARRESGKGPADARMRIRPPVPRAEAAE